MSLGLGLGIGIIRAGVIALPWYTLGKADDTDPSFWADFANNRYAVNGAEEAFTDIFTFTSSTTGTYFDSNGVLQTAAINEPRFDHNPLTGEKLGLLVEGQRTNLQKYSDGSGGFSSGNYLGVTATKIRTETRRGIQGTVINVFGTSTGTGGFLLPTCNSSDIAATNGQTYAVSCFSEVIENRGANIPPLKLGVRTLNGTSQIDFDRPSRDLELEVGFGRRSGTMTTDQAATTGVQTGIEVSFGSGQTFDFDIWVGGIQIELADFPSSYIPTAGSAVTRTADMVSNSSSNTVKFADWYNQSEGTVLARAKGIGGDSSYPRLIEASDGTGGNRLTINLDISTRNVSFGIFNGGALQASRTSLISGLSAFSAGTAYKTNDFAFSINGDGPTTDTSVTPPTVTKLNVGADYTGSSSIYYGYIHELRYYNKRISNTELQRITS